VNPAALPKPQVSAPDHQVTGPSGSFVPPPPANTSSAPVEVAQVPRVDDRSIQEPPSPADPPQKSFEELTVVADSVIGLQAQTTVTSEQARIEDRVEARVSRDVRVHVEAVSARSGTRP